MRMVITYAGAGCTAIEEPTPDVAIGEVNDTGFLANEPQDVQITAASSRLPDFDVMVLGRSLLCTLS